MNDEQIKQRIAYLVQHGGLYEDPIEDLRSKVRLLRWAIGALLGLSAVELALIALH